MTMPRTPAALRLVPETETAAPALRLLLFVGGRFGDDEAGREAARAIHGGFERLHGDRAPMASLNLAGSGAGRVKRAGKATLDKVASFFDLKVASYGQAVRRYGPVRVEADEPWLPFFAIEQWSDGFHIEIAVPPEGTHARPLTELVEANLADLDPLCGAIGYGFWFPPRLSSLVAYIGHRAEKWPAAMAVTAQVGTSVVFEPRSPGGELARWWEGPAGLADVGWKTIVGRSFADRLPDLSTLPYGVTVERTGHATTITAGPRPIWGWAAQGEPDADGPDGEAALARMAAVARVLAPLRARDREAARANFRSCARQEDEVPACRAYFDRLDRWAAD